MCVILTWLTSTSPLAAPCEKLGRICHVELNAASRHITLATRRSALQQRILTARDVDTRHWDNTTIT